MGTQKLLVFFLELFLPCCLLDQTQWERSRQQIGLTRSSVHVGQQKALHIVYETINVTQLTEAGIQLSGYSYQEESEG